MQLVNILLTVGLIILVSGITILSICAFIATPRSKANHNQANRQERRKCTARSFPVTCEDGTMIYFDRRLKT